jgi:hypothetical protein
MVLALIDLFKKVIAVAKYIFFKFLILSMGCDSGIFVIRIL